MLYESFGCPSRVTGGHGDVHAPNWWPFRIAGVTMRIDVSHVSGRNIRDDYRREPAEYAASTKLVRLLYGDGAPDHLKFIEAFHQMGPLNYSAEIYDVHVMFAEWGSESIQPIGYVFDPLIVRKWKTVNRLLYESYQEGWLKSEGQPLAAFVGFAVLEEVARRISGLWTEEGFLTEDPPQEVMPFRQFRDDESGWKDRTDLKSGKRIIHLAHKLELMRHALPAGFRRSLEQLDSVVDRPIIEGVPSIPGTLFQRMQYSRDHRSHGRRYEGLDAWWISLLVAMLYHRLPAYTAGGRPERGDWLAA